MSDRKAVIKNADMSEEMQQDAVDSATQAMEKFNIEKVSFCGQSRRVSRIAYCFGNASSHKAYHIMGIPRTER